MAAALLCTGACTNSVERSPAADGGVDGASDSGSADGSAPGPGRCVGAGDCIPWACHCSDGSALRSATICAAGRCAEGELTCEFLCEEAGGLTSFEPWPNVIGSAECDDYCAEGDGLACPGDIGCDSTFHCLVPEGSCPAAHRATLACNVAEGTWECSPSGGRRVSSIGCSAFEDLCE
ncbi:MAG: hypothetical protein DRJ42_26110 [Deltaproteobacteria bacterium]|nr:MAG: hypothetical protein DRJ42_26110 [Deltaproteobacteria bacterium]